MMSKVYTTFEISRFCSVDISTVMGWVDDGKLKAYRTPGGHRRVSHPDLLSFLEKYQMPIHPALQVRQARVLIIEDNPVTVRILKRAIEKFVPSDEIEVALDGFEAGRKLEMFQPDLILLDLMLPGVDGFQVCKNIRGDERKKNVKILAISGLKGEETRKRILSMGADAFLAKPFELSDIRNVVSSLIGENRHDQRGDRHSEEPARTSR